MRFKATKPKPYQVRYLKRFAILPFWYGEEPNQIVIWLEWYWQKQRTAGNYYWFNDGKYPIEHDRSDATV